MVGGDDLSFAEPPVEEPSGSWEQRELQVKGRDQAVRAWSLRLASAVAT
jgi:hypothetical protein